MSDTNCNSNYPNTVADIANEIKFDLESDSSLSIAYISSWIRNNVGQLNNAIGTQYKLDENLEICPCISNNAKDIFKWLFICRYYDRKANANLGASAYDWSSVEEGDSKIRRVSKNEIAKTFLQLASQCKESLKLMITYYKTNRALPVSISSVNSPQSMYCRVADPHQPISWPLPFFPVTPLQ